MRVKLISCSILLLVNSVFASDVTIYKWIDDKGIVHFSNSHPADKDATIVDIQVAYSSSIDEINESVQSEETPNVQDQEYTERAEKNIKMFAQNCKSAQANKKILTSFKKVLIKDEDGNDMLLTGDDITAELELTDKHIDIYCNVDK
ncbi:MAG: DUF4124 domain-containing protein [Colwellia sp.]|nr:DUF4124 domain-containing protein [Colwellia sp.]